MKILVINCGSSSIKYKLYNFPANSLITKGIIERIGEKASVIKNHAQGIKAVVADILKKKVIQSLVEISAIGHRVVHGGEWFRQPCVINDEIIKKIKECSELAPLHNPVNLAGINGCKRIFPNVPQVAVFDTAFHQSIPEQAYLYALPYKYYQRYHIRRYGFHGTSHRYVAREAAKKLNRPIEELKIITCHLGNGCSITAVKEGKSVETSMGFTPLEGLIMGTRSGDLDPAIIAYLCDKEKLTADKVIEILNKTSGLAGISGLTNDYRDLLKAAEENNTRAKLAIEMFFYRIKKYIGAYMAVMNGVDAIVFTAGIGENQPILRERVAKELSNIIDPQKVKILVIATNEELTIAHDTFEIINAQKKTVT